MYLDNRVFILISKQTNTIITDSIRLTEDEIIRYNIILPTFVTKVTKYLCSVVFFFFRQISTFHLAIFDVFLKNIIKNVLLP